MRLIAHWTYIRSRCSYHYMSAIATLPHGDARFVEHFHSLNIMKKFAISFLVFFFYSTNSSELSSKLNKTFFLRILSHAFIHVSPLSILTFRSCKKILLQMPLINSSPFLFLHTCFLTCLLPPLLFHEFNISTLPPANYIHYNTCKTYYCYRL